MKLCEGSCPLSGHLSQATTVRLGPSRLLLHPISPKTLPRPSPHPSRPGGEARRSALPLGGPSAPPSPAASVPAVAGRWALRGAGPAAMSHGARVIRTGVSSAGPAATSPPAASSSASASSDGELVDGAYFRSCAGMLKVAQMVRRQGPGGCRRASACGEVLRGRRWKRRWARKGGHRRWD